MMNFRPSADASMVVVRDGNRVLLVRRRDVPVWVLPGGGIDPGESPEEAAVREALEETGLHVRLTRKVAEYEIHGRFTRPTHLFEAEVLSGEITTNDEADRVAWWPADQLPEGLVSFQRIWIKEALEERPEVIHRPLTEVTPWAILRIFFAHPIAGITYFLKRVFGRL